MIARVQELGAIKSTHSRHAALFSQLQSAFSHALRVSGEKLTIRTEKSETKIFYAVSCDATDLIVRDQRALPLCRAFPKRESFIHFAAAMQTKASHNIRKLFMTTPLGS
jgi:hypothetical protein